VWFCAYLTHLMTSVMNVSNMTSVTNIYRHTGDHKSGHSEREVAGVQSRASMRELIFVEEKARVL